MAGNFYNNRDSVDISELAALNDDISDDLINHLQQQITDNLPQENPNGNENNTTSNKNDMTDTEATSKGTQAQDGAPGIQINDLNTPSDKKVEVNKSFDDNFIKKYKAKLQKKQKGTQEDTAPISYGGVAPGGTENDDIDSSLPPRSSNTDSTPIESLSQGNITEKPLTNDLINYNDSLDFLDGNVKYSKYVIYIDPENVDFIESLTVKERKNLINGILHQQNDITITKQRFKVIQTVVRHVIVLILTIAISIPVVYHVINASLEVTINNHRYAQTNWQTLYRENGKITRH